MADGNSPGQDDGGVESHAPDPASENRETQAESREATLEQFESQRRATVGIEARERQTEGEIALRETGERLNADLERIQGIDLDKSIEEQDPKAMSLLRRGSMALFEKLQTLGFRVETMDELPTPSEYTDRLTNELRTGSVELAILKKLREIGAPESQVRTFAQQGEWGGEWERLVARGQTFHPVREELTNPGKKEQEGWVKDAAGGILDYAKEHPFKTAALLGVGAIGLYGLFKTIPKFIKGLFESDSDWGFGKAFDFTKGALPVGFIAGSLLLVGTILGPDSWRGWMQKYLKINLSAENIWEFIKTGEIDALREGVSTIDDATAAAAEFLGVDPEKIAILKNVPFSQFDNTVHEWTNRLKGLGYEAAALAGIDLNVPFIHDAEENRKAVEATSKLQELFNEPRAADILERAKPKTVGEALEALEHEHYFAAGTVATGAEGVAGTAEGRHDMEDPYDGAFQDDESLFGSGPDQIGIDEKSWDELKEKMGGHSNVKEWLDTHEGWSLINPLELGKLAVAVKDDGLALVQTRKGLMLWDGFEMIFLTPLYGMADTASMAMSAALTEEHNWKDVVAKYYDKQLGWVMIFGGPAIIRGIGQMGKGALTLDAAKMFEGLKETTRGVAKGTAGPILMLWWEGEKLADIKRGMTEGKFEARIRMAKGPEAQALRYRIRMQQLRFYGETFRIFRKRYDAATSGKWLSTEEGVSTARHLGRKGLGILRQERLVKLMRKYAKRFSDMYNGLLEDANKPLKDFKGKPVEEVFGKDFDPSKVNTAVNDFLEWDDARLESELKAKVDPRAAELKTEFEGTGEYKKFTREQAERMCRERGFEIDSEEGKAYMEEWYKKVAEQEIRGEKFNPNIELGELETTAGAKFKPKARLELLKEKPNGARVYRYNGLTIEVPSETFNGIATGDIMAQYEAARTHVQAKWRIPARQAFAEQVVEVIPPEETGGQAKYKLRSGEVVEAPNFDGAFERYAAELEAGGKPVPEGFKATLKKCAGIVPELEMVLGTAGTAYIFYELLTAEDKEEAVKHVLATIMLAFGGAKFFESTMGRMSTNPMYHLIGNIAFGILAIFGFQDKAEYFLNEAFKKIPGLSESTHIISRHLMVRSAVNWAARPILRTTARLGEKYGIRVIEKYLLKKIEGQLAKRLLRLTSGKLVRTILKQLGWKGVAIGVGLADDATVIGVIDDILVVGLAIWSVYDIYCIVDTVHNAIKLKSELDKRSGKPVSNIEFIDHENRASVVQKLEAAGFAKNEIYIGGKINPEIWSQLGDQEMFDILDNAHFKIYREGIGGYEEYQLSGGDIKKVIIFDDSGKEIASMTDEKLKEAEKAEEEYEAAIQTEGQASSNEDEPPSEGQVLLTAA